MSVEKEKVSELREKGEKMSTRSISILNKVLDRGNATVAYLMGGIAFGGGVGGAVGGTTGLVLGAVAGAVFGAWISYSIESDRK